MPAFRFSALAGRRLHLVVCGSIAAYKAVELMRMAMKAGLWVGVTVTPAAARFITPLTFSQILPQFGWPPAIAGNNALSGPL